MNSPETELFQNKSNINKELKPGKVITNYVNDGKYIYTHTKQNKEENIVLFLPFKGLRE